MGDHRRRDDVLVHLDAGDSLSTVATALKGAIPSASYTVALTGDARRARR